jgi:hypothetical protein
MSNKTWWGHLWPMIMLTAYLGYAWSRPESSTGLQVLGDTLIITGCVVFSGLSLSEQRPEAKVSRAKWGYRIGLIFCLTGFMIRIIG